MRQQAWQPTQVTFGALAKAAARDGHWRMVQQLLAEMENAQVEVW